MNTIKQLTHYSMDACRLNSTISPTTKTDEFFSEWAKYPELTLYTGSNGKYDVGNTPLHQAASEGNVELIELIVEVGDKALLALCNLLGKTPLNCAITCNNGNDKGYLATKKLIELGAPLNVRSIEERADVECVNTPLEEALLAYALYGQDLQKAVLLLQSGAVSAREDIRYRKSEKAIATLNISSCIQAAKALARQDFTDKAMLFKKGIESDTLPDDIKNHILSISVALAPKFD